MMSELRAWFDRKFQVQRGGQARRARLGVESLEERQVLSITYHGGALLPHVEVQGMYYGSDWYNNSTYYNQTGYLDGFLNNLVHGSYMDMLGNAGYNVGRGSFDQGIINRSTLNKTTALTDSQIRSALQGEIRGGYLKAPDGNRLYVVFVEDNVQITAGGETSKRDFLGYHSVFAGTDAAGRAADIHYAVIAYPGGSVGNATDPWLPAAQQLTQVTSHEVAEAVTDPNIGYKAKGWYDDTTSSEGENGDLAANQTVYLNGYAVQRIADRNGQAMTPVGATASVAESFVLYGNGNLYKHGSAGWTFVSSGIASVSDQTIDLQGHVMVDVVTTGGTAYEYHDGTWTYLDSGVRSAKASQGVSYVLYASGKLYEFQDVNKHWTYLDTNVASIDAGTDKFGVSSVDVLYTSGVAYEHSNSTGWHYLTSGVRSISAGQQGVSDLVTTAGSAYYYNEAANSFNFLSSGVAQVTAGTDASGNYMIDLLFSNGNLSEYRSGSWTSLWGGVKSIGKARGGLVDVVFNSGYAYEHDGSGWHYLDTGAAASV